MAGYPGSPGTRLSLVNLVSGESRSLALPEDPGEVWRRYFFHLPPDWRGAGLRLAAEDEVAVDGRWLAVSEPIWSAREPGALPWVLLAVVLHGGLLLLPGAAAAVVGRRLGLVADEWLVPVVTLASCGAGLLAFWSFFLSPLAGWVFSWALYGVSSATLLWSALHRSPGPLGDRFTAVAFGLAFLGVLLAAAAGFAWGDIRSPLRSAATRQFHRLPSDNLIPLKLAEGIYEGEIRRPLVEDWLSSDRPPLQAGIFVLQMPVIESLPFQSRRFQYHITGMWLQALWMPALLWFLRRAAVSHWTAAATIAVTAFSGFAAIFGFFVWPKLAAGALLLFPAAQLLVEFDASWRRSVTWGAMAGLAAALALLAHGTGVFALLGLGAATLVLRRAPAPRVVVSAALVAAVVYLPWVAYQRFFDPPGNRLAKWGLAGSETPDARSLGQALVEEYRRLSLPEVTRYKVANLLVLFEGAGDSARDLWSLLSLSDLDAHGRWTARDRLRRRSFFQTFQAFGLLNLGLVAFLFASADRRRRATPEYKAALRIFVGVGATLVIWCLMLFGPGSTVIHQGTTLTMLLGFAGLACALAAASRWLLLGASAANVAIGAYLFLLTPGRQMFPSPGTLTPDTLDRPLAVAALLVGLAFLGTLASTWTGRHFPGGDPRKSPIFR